MNKEVIELPWLTDLASTTEASRARGQLPHALLLHGPAGTGRRYFGLWLASRLLGAGAPPLVAAVRPGEAVDTDAWPAHPDLLVVQPPPDKRLIPIDRVREMIGFLQLTAHQGGAKVALVTPAEALSHAAANSLLKTLEEPPLGSTILLVAEQPSRLPATVVSRCQKLRIALPPAGPAVAWLAGQQPGPDWTTVLHLAGGAPLRAVLWEERGFTAEAARLAADLDDLGAGRSGVVAVARRWARLDAGLVLDWLYRQAAGRIRQRLAGPPETGNAPLQNAPGALNMEPLFAYLRDIGELRRLQGAGLSMELNFARLLGMWQRGGALAGD